MIFTETPLAGAWIIDVDRKPDERGFFARTWAREEFEDRRLVTHIEQCSLSHNTLAGTLRGMHYQAEPHGETKIVRCTAGRIFDVIVDVRPDSPTYLQWFSVELSAENRRMLYVPKLFAHGYITLENDTEVFYQIDHAHHDEAAKGLRWDDPKVGIKWPIEKVVISPKDEGWALLP